MNIKLKIAYDGTHLHGWQNNKSERSVEGELKKALVEFLDHPVKLQAASRTDRGVHARGQIVNFFTPKEIDFCQFQKKLNEILDEDIRLLHAEKAHDTFHPTLDVKAKEYRYVIFRAKVRPPVLRLHSWHYPFITNLDLMREAAHRITGTHDFSGFSNVNLSMDMEDCIRTIYSIDIQEQGDEFHIVLRGDHFLYKMVRNIAGTLAYIGSKKLEMSVIDEMFTLKDRTRGGVTAPAEGLFLDEIFY